MTLCVSAWMFWYVFLFGFVFVAKLSISIVVETTQCFISRTRTIFDCHTLSTEHNWMRMRLRFNLHFTVENDNHNKNNNNNDISRKVQLMFRCSAEKLHRFDFITSAFVATENLNNNMSSRWIQQQPKKHIT